MHQSLPAITLLKMDSCPGDTAWRGWFNVSNSIAFGGGRFRVDFVASLLNQEWVPRLGIVFA